jgi:hypothetical protein
MMEVGPFLDSCPSWKFPRRVPNGGSCAVSKENERVLPSRCASLCARTRKRPRCHENSRAPSSWLPLSWPPTRRERARYIRLAHAEPFSLFIRRMRMDTVLSRVRYRGTCARLGRLWQQVGFPARFEHARTLTGALPTATFCESVLWRQERAHTPARAFHEVPCAPDATIAIGGNSAIRQFTQLDNSDRQTVEVGPTFAMKCNSTGRWQ